MTVCQMADLSGERFSISVSDRAEKHVAPTGEVRNHQVPERLPLKTQPQGAVRRTVDSPSAIPYTWAEVVASEKWFPWQPGLWGQAPT